MRKLFAIIVSLSIVLIFVNLARSADITLNVNPVIESGSSDTAYFGSELTIESINNTGDDTGDNNITGPGWITYSDLDLQQIIKYAGVILFFVFIGIIALAAARKK